MSTARRIEDPRNGSVDRRLANALGWLSVGLGVMEAAAPRAVARLAGVRGLSTGLLRAIALREVVSGVGILASGRKAPWLLARVAGDVMDLAALGAGARSAGSSAGRNRAAAAAVAAVTALDLRARRRQKHAEPECLTAVASITINRLAPEIYRFWRRLGNLPQVMTHVASVEELDERRSHWVIRALGTTLEWDAEIVEEEPDARLAWRSLVDAAVPNEGTLDLTPAPGGRGTEVRLTMDYRPPAGEVGTLFAKILGGDPSARVFEDLRRMKRLLETGEIPTTQGQPSGKRTLLGRGLGRLEQSESAADSGADAAPREAAS